MIRTLIGTLLTLAVWIVVWFILSSLGVLILKKARLFKPTALVWGESFWVGWFALICVLQVWHFFYKVGGLFLIILALAGLASLPVTFPELKRFVLQNRRQTLFLLLTAGLSGLWLANRALWYLEPLSGFVQWDMGSYHLQAVKWIAEYPLVPGLANINIHLGYNSTFFLYASIFDFWIWNGQSNYLAFGFLMFAVLIQSLQGLYLLAATDEVGSRIGLYLALMLIPLLLLANYANSLETDYVIFLLMLLMGGQLYLFYLERQASIPAPQSPQSPVRDFRYRVFLIALIAAVGSTVKLSFAVYGLVSLLVTLALTLPPATQAWRAWLHCYLPPLLAVFAVLLLPWIARSYFISGYPFFPATSFALNLPWKVPPAQAIEEYGHIRTVAREVKPGVDYAIINGWTWFPRWMSEIPPEIIKCANLALLCLLALVLPCPPAPSSIDRGSPPSPSRPLTILTGRRLGWTLFLPLLIYGLFWFRMAPAIRFIEGALWSAVILLVCFTVNRLETIVKNPARVLTIITLAGLFLWFAPIRTPLWIVVQNANQWGLTEQYLPALDQRVTQSGLQVNFATPGEKDEMRCWNAPLPCVISFDKNLEALPFTLFGQPRPAYRLNQ